MRYYRIEIAGFTEADAGLDENGVPILFKNVKRTPEIVYSSHLSNGQMNPGALNISFNISIAFLHNNANVGSFVQIQGLPLETLSQGYNLRGKHIRIFGGMTKNYNVNKEDTGLLLNGVIVSPYGNWEGTNQTLTFYIIPSIYESNRSITLHWAKNQLLSQAIKSALTSSFPNSKIIVNISKKNDVMALKMQGTTPLKINDFAISLYQQKDVYKTQAINLYVKDKTIIVTDSIFGKKIKLENKDMVGQPTWSDSNNINVSLVLRSDININDIVVFPKETSKLGIFKTTSPSSNFLVNRGLQSDIKNKPIFQGEYRVLSVQHIGEYKSPSANSWITFLTLSTINKDDNIDITADYNSPEIGGLY